MAQRPVIDAVDEIRVSRLVRGGELVCEVHKPQGTAWTGPPPPLLQPRRGIRACLTDSRFVCDGGLGNTFFEVTEGKDCSLVPSKGSVTFGRSGMRLWQRVHRSSWIRQAKLPHPG